MLHELIPDLVTMAIHPRPGVSKGTRLLSALAMLCLSAALGAGGWWLIRGAFFAGEIADEKTNAGGSMLLWEASSLLGYVGVLVAFFASVMAVISLVMLLRLPWPDPKPEPKRSYKRNARRLEEQRAEEQRSEED